jgi:hypothetical protein
VQRAGKANHAVSVPEAKPHLPWQGDGIVGTTAEMALQAYEIAMQAADMCGTIFLCIARARHAESALAESPSR